MPTNLPLVSLVSHGSLAEQRRHLTVNQAQVTSPHRKCKSCTAHSALSPTVTRGCTVRTLVCWRAWRASLAWLAGRVDGERGW